jgi:hypothetical protein
MDWVAWYDCYIQVNIELWNGMSVETQAFEGRGAWVLFLSILQEVIEIELNAMMKEWGDVIGTSFY